MAGNAAVDLANSTGRVFMNALDNIGGGPAMGSLAAQRGYVSLEMLGGGGRGPMIFSPRAAVDLSEFQRLNQIDASAGVFRPGEAGAAAELQGLLGGQLERSGVGQAGDFIFTSGPYGGKSVDFMFTANSTKQASMIDKYFESNFESNVMQLQSHLGKADLVPLDIRNVNMANQQRFMQAVQDLSIADRQRVIIFR